MPLLVALISILPGAINVKLSFALNAALIPFPPLALRIRSPGSSSESKNMSSPAIYPGKSVPVFTSIALVSLVTIIFPPL